MEYEIKVVDPADRRQVARCFPVFSVLRPHLTEALFIEGVARQTSETYKIAYIELEDEVSAAAGYRIAHFLAFGKVLYIDDLVTHPERKNRGLGGALMDWLVEQARQLDCDAVELDTGFQRHDAHRLYLNKGFTLACHHMSLRLEKA